MANLSESAVSLALSGQRDITAKELFDFIRYVKAPPPALIKVLSNVGFDVTKRADTPEIDNSRIPAPDERLLRQWAVHLIDLVLAAVGKPGSLHEDEIEALVKNAQRAYGALAILESQRHHIQATPNSAGHPPQTHSATAARKAGTKSANKPK